MCILAFIVTSADIHVSQLWVYLYAILLIYCLRLSGCLQTCNVYRAGGDIVLTNVYKLSWSLVLI